MHMENTTTSRKCKFCKTPLKERFIDTVLPKVINYSKLRHSNGSLATFICSKCFLVQREGSLRYIEQEQDFVSSYSTYFLNELNQYIVKSFKRFEKIENNLVAELSWHPDTLLKSCILPFGNKGLSKLIDMYGKADMLICKDALSYTSDLNDFVSAIKSFLKPKGVATLEFIHILPLMETSRFDVPATTNFPYFSFTTIDTIFRHHGLTIYNSEACSPKGSIRLFAKHTENLSQHISINIPLLRGRERDKGMSSLKHYLDFKDGYDLEKQKMEMGVMLRGNLLNNK